MDPFEGRKNPFDHMKFYENLSDMESTLPNDKDHQSRIHQGGDIDKLEDGHGHMTYEMQ